MKFTVYGRPEPQGSMRSFRHRHSGKVVTTSANAKLKPWRNVVSTTARNVWGALSYHGPMEMSLKFFFKRPKGAPKHRVYPTVKPDTDKLIRAILDALTGILYHDDSQVVRFTHVSKEYGEPERVEIELREL